MSLIKRSVLVKMVTIVPAVTVVTVVQPVYSSLELVSPRLTRTTCGQRAHQHQRQLDLAARQQHPDPGHDNTGEHGRQLELLGEWQRGQRRRLGAGHRQR